MHVSPVHAAANLCSNSLTVATPVEAQLSDGVVLRCVHSVRAAAVFKQHREVCLIMIDTLYRGP